MNKCDKVPPCRKHPLASAPKLHIGFWSTPCFARKAPRHSHDSPRSCSCCCCCCCPSSSFPGRNLKEVVQDSDCYSVLHSGDSSNAHKSTSSYLRRSLIASGRILLLSASSIPCVDGPLCSLLLLRSNLGISHKLLFPLSLLANSSLYFEPPDYTIRTTALELLIASISSHNPALCANHPHGTCWVTVRMTAPCLAGGPPPRS